MVPSLCTRSLVCAAPAGGVSEQVDVGFLLQSLVSQGLLSQSLRASAAAPPHSGPTRECEGHTGELEVVADRLALSLPDGVTVRSVARVECSAAATAAYTAVLSSLGPERLLWHGTSWESVPNIVRHGFNRAYSFRGRHGAKLGKGSYFAEDPKYALRFCGGGRRHGAPRALFLVGVLPGRVAKGEEGLLEPPADGAGARFDSTVDCVAAPKVFCTFRDFQALPLYLVEVS